MSMRFLNIKGLTILQFTTNKQFKHHTSRTVSKSISSSGFITQSFRFSLYIGTISVNSIFSGTCYCYYQLQSGLCVIHFNSISEMVPYFCTSLVNVSYANELFPCMTAGTLQQPLDSMVRNCGHSFDFGKHSAIYLWELCQIQRMLYVSN